MADQTDDARVHDDDVHFTNHRDDTLEELIAAAHSLTDADSELTRIRITSGSRSIELERTHSKPEAQSKAEPTQESALTDVSDVTDVSEDGAQQPLGRHRREASEG